jgi:signal transduction histidine kinase
MVPSVETYSSIEQIQIPVERLISDILLFNSSDEESMQEIYDRLEIISSKIRVLSGDTPLGRPFFKNKKFQEGLKGLIDAMDDSRKAIDEMKVGTSKREVVVKNIVKVRSYLVELNNIAYSDHVQWYARAVATLNSDRRLIYLVYVGAWMFFVILGALFIFVGERHRRVASERYEAIKQKNTLAVAINHELRNPLQSLIGIVDIFLDKIKGLGGENLVSDISSLTKRMEGCLERINTCMRDFAEYSRMEMAPPKIKNKEVNVVELVEELIVDFKDIAEPQNLFLRFYYSTSKDKFYIDPVRVRQVLENLLSNSIKFTERGGITVSLDQVGMPVRELIFHVEDTGIGMTKDQCVKIFDAFVRVHSEKRIEGLGLGLFIARQLMTLMRGSIEVVSWPDKGTRFTVRLPVD